MPVLTGSISQRQELFSRGRHLTLSLWGRGGKRGFPWPSWSVGWGMLSGDRTGMAVGRCQAKSWSIYSWDQRGSHWVSGIGVLGQQSRSEKNGNYTVTPFGPQAHISLTFPGPFQNPKPSILFSSPLLVSRVHSLLSLTYLPFVVPENLKTRLPWMGSYQSFLLLTLQIKDRVTWKQEAINPILGLFHS